MAHESIQAHKERCFDCVYHTNKHAQKPCKALQQLKELTQARIAFISSIRKLVVK